LVAPILQTFILDHDPQQLGVWVDRISNWDFQQIIPCHFDGPITANSQQFRQAFAGLTPGAEEPVFGSENQPLPLQDVQFIQTLEKALDQRGITAPPR